MFMTYYYADAMYLSQNFTKMFATKIKIYLFNTDTV